jgi:hypothetical protein
VCVCVSVRLLISHHDPVLTRTRTLRDTNLSFFPTNIPGSEDEDGD